MMNWANDWATGSGWTGLVLMLLCMGVVVAAGVALIALLTRSGPARVATTESPRQILDRRFASGEIDAEAYAAARRAMEDHQPTW